MKYGYIRVSTKGQAKDGNSLESQEQLLKETGVEKIYKDVFTGKKIDRPNLNELLKLLKPGDVLICTKLDRLARSVGQASDLITDLIDRGIIVNILNLGILSNNSVSTLLRNVLLSFAQFERDMILERTQEGKAMARQKNSFKEGRPRALSAEHEEHVMKLLDSGEYTYKKIAKLMHVSESTIYRIARRRA